MATTHLVCSHNYALVALSVLIAMFASYAALDLAGRVTAAGGWTRAVWLLGGAGAMGTGIWSMHYIGMLACILPLPVAYHWPTVLLSLFAAILASAIALYVVSRQQMAAFRAFVGSILMGGGIASMHYIGMAAMRMSAITHYDSFLVVLSLVFAVLISLAALWITFHLRDEKAATGWRKIAGAVVMGAAIPVMHYTGMAAAHFTPSGMPADLSRAISISTLGTAGIASVTFIVLGLALLTSWLDRRFAAQTVELHEAKLQRSEAYLAEAQRLSHTGSFGWRVSTGEIIWSEETYRIFQYDKITTPTVESVLQRVHPEDAALVKQTIESASQNGKAFDFEHRLLMPDGSVKYVHIVTHAGRDELGGLEFVGAVMDVTVAREAEDKIRLIINTVPGLLWTARPDGWVDFLSQRWLDYTGMTLEQGLGWAWQPGYHPDDLDNVLSKWRAAVAERKPLEVEARLRRFDGEYRWFLKRAFPLFDNAGRVRGWYGGNIDIHDLKQAEAALRQAQADLAHVSRVSTMGELTASIAHEVNQPLTAVVNNANACLVFLAAATKRSGQGEGGQAGFADFQEIRDALTEIVDDTNRASAVIARVRQLAKKAPFERARLHLKDVIADVLALARYECTTRLTAIRADLADDLPLVLGDRVQLQQVLLNLVINGMDAMKTVEESKRVLIICGRSQMRDGIPEACLSVQDAGTGFKPGEMERLFETFYTTKAHGMGMGLAISRSIIEAHGGRLWAEPNQGPGATFSFTLPAAASKPGAGGPAMPEPLGEGSTRTSNDDRLQAAPKSQP